MLEAQCHPHSFFSTFTYEVEPDGRSLVKDHISQTMHRLRESARRASKTVRFYAAGEYGELGGRPHYHAAIYGLGPDDYPLIDRAWQGINGVESGPRAGYTYHGVLAPDAAYYITGYITKKLTGPGVSRIDPSTGRRDQRHPEFAVMSRNPGIGLPFLLSLVDGFNTSAGALYLARNGDVPTSIVCAGKTLPLGQYIRSRLRLALLGDEHQPRSGADVRGLKDHVKFLSTLPPMPVDSTHFEKLTIYLKTMEDYKAQKKITLKQRGLQVRNRYKIHQQRKSL